MNYSLWAQFFKNISLKKAVLILLSITVVIIPFLVSKKVFYAYEFPKMIALYILTPLLLFMLRCIPSKEQKPISYANVLIFLYFGWLLINCLTSLEPAVSFFGAYGNFDGLFFLIFSIGFFFLGEQFKEQKLAFIILLIASSFIISVIGIYEFLHGEFRAASTFGNSINLSNFLALIIPCLLSLIFSDAIKGKFLKISSHLCFLVLIVAQILTFSRSGWFGTLFVFIMFFVFSKKEILNRYRTLITLSVILVLSIGICYFCVKNQSGHLIIKTQRINKMSEVNDQRLPQYISALKVFLQYPLGSGLSTYNFTATKFLPLGISKKIWTNAHNDFLNTLASQGIIGGLFYLILIIFLVKMCLKWFKSPTTDPLNAGLWAGVFGHLLIIQTNFPAYGYTYLFWFFIGMLSDSQPVKANSITSSIFQKRFVWEPIIWGLIFIFAIFFSYSYSRADILFVQSMKSFENGHPEKASRLIGQSVHLAPWVEPYKGYKLEYDLTILKHQKLSPVKRQLTVNTIQQELIEINSINPLNHRYLSMTGNALMELQQYPKAILFYQQALKLFPNNADYYNQIGYAFIHLDKFSDAYANFTKAAAMDPSNQFAHECLQWLDKQKSINNNEPSKTKREINK